ncbi:MAG TPA: cell division protein FtsQ/DivIB [Candidatus Saccharimonadia bacterium]|nr:cell division protein FtsQ/DivIB [Candidatus Saccharimonadia bacterium]
MSQRRVRSGREIYGRREPLRRPVRSKIWRPKMTLLQRRLLILVVIVFGGLYGFSRLFAIQHIVVNSPTTRQTAIAGEVRKLIDGSVWQENIVTLDGGKLAADLQKTDPTINTVVVGRSLLHTVIITTTLRQPSLGWSTGDQQYLLDLDGTAIGPFPAGSSLPMVTDGSNLPVSVGQQVAPQQFVAFVVDLVPALKADGYNVTGLNISDTTFDLTVSTNKGYQLIFDTTRAVGDEISDLKSVQALLVQQHKTPSKYVDLRIAGKAYWQ